MSFPARFQIGVTGFDSPMAVLFESNPEGSPKEFYAAVRDAKAEVEQMVEALGPDVVGQLNRIASYDSCYDTVEGPENR